MTALCRFTAHGCFMPSSSLSTISDGALRMVDVIGATTITHVSRCGEGSKAPTQSQKARLHGAGGIRHLKGNR